MDFIIYSIFILGFLLCLWLIFYAFKRLGKGWTWKFFFKDFKRKLWMTISLGFVFFLIYLMGIFLSVYLVKYEKKDVFFIVYQNPLSFVYGGLWLFICCSLSIYFVRMLIKYLYLTRGKDSS